MVHCQAMRNDRNPSRGRVYDVVASMIASSRFCSGPHLLRTRKPTPNSTTATGTA